jgi:hypothetical protein
MAIKIDTWEYKELKYGNDHKITRTFRPFWDKFLCSIPAPKYYAQDEIKKWGGYLIIKEGPGGKSMQQIVFENDCDATAFMLIWTP